jgi:hypothetical protein
VPDGAEAEPAQSPSHDVDGPCHSAGHGTLSSLACGVQQSDTAKALSVMFHVTEGLQMGGIACMLYNHALQADRLAAEAAAAAQRAKAQLQQASCAVFCSKELLLQLKGGRASRPASGAARVLVPQQRTCLSTCGSLDCCRQWSCPVQVTLKTLLWHSSAERGMTRPLPKSSKMHVRAQPD